MTLPSESTLVHRLRNAVTSEDQRPVSFILGAGVSNGATPSTAKMVEYFVNTMSRDAEDKRDLEALLAATPVADRYQVAAEFVLDRGGIARLNRAVRFAVLSARTPSLGDLALSYLNKPDELERLDADWRGWVIPRGLSALGRLLEIIPSEVRGQILTTNFDPLIEASLSAAGLTPHPVVADIDGTIASTAQLPTVVSVSHLHGYWNKGDTLSTGAQLTRPRPRLAGSLRQILTHSTCVVLGYGGWDDLLTKSVMELVAEGAERDIEILWACHGPTPQLGRLTEQTLPGRLQPYVDVDVNRLLPDVEAAVRKRLQPTPRKRSSRTAARQPVLAFDEINDVFLDSHLARDASPINAISYFDGRPPNWVDAMGDRAPRLARTREIEEILKSQRESSLVFLIAGPTGEGKSTMLRQLAGSLGRDVTKRVLWMSAAQGFKPKDIIAITATSDEVWIVIDDADLHVRAIADTAAALTERSRSDVRLLVAARDGDWARAVQLQSANMSSRVLRRFDVGGMTLDDANSIAAAWASFGQRALGKMEAVSADQRGRKLFEASQGISEAALLGAMLETRYGNEFRQHIWELMARLSHVALPGGTRLLDAYSAICVFAHHNISHLSLAHLGAWLNISETEVDGLVVYRLGREAAAERHGDSIIPRHRRIAQAVVELLPEFGIAEADVVGGVVESVVRTAKGAHWTDEVVAIAYCGQRVKEKTLALAAADGAVRGDPDQLRLVNYRLGVYRDFSEFGAADRIGEEAWKSIGRFRDPKLTLRRFLMTWARAVGTLGRYRDSAALNACGLLDSPEMGSLDIEEASRGLNGIAWSLGQLPDKASHSSGRGACAESSLYIAKITDLREQAERLVEEARADGYHGMDATKQSGDRRDYPSERPLREGWPGTTIYERRQLDQLVAPARAAVGIRRRPVQGAPRGRPRPAIASAPDRGTRRATRRRRRRRRATA